MKKVINGFLAILGIIVLACLLAFISGNGHLVKAVANTYLKGRKGPSIDEYAIFDSRKVTRSTSPFHWKEKSLESQKKLSKEEEVFHQQYQTAAFLVLKKDSIIFEKYWDDYSLNSKTNSFSVAKSFIGILIGAAIKDGFIKSIKQPIHEILPEYNTGLGKEITIEHLLQMTSGIEFGESYGDPFGFMAKAYYGIDLYDLTIDKPVVEKPGTVWKYQGGNTLLLSFIIEKTTEKKVADYFSEKIWQPIGAEEDALWNLDDKNGKEKAYCCFYSNARDFAKIGKLYHQNGQFNGKTLIPESYVLKSKTPAYVTDATGNLVDYYGYQWWMTSVENETLHYARGILGQYIVIIPNEELIFVRLGRLRADEKINNVPIDLIEYIKMAKRLN